MPLIKIDYSQDILTPEIVDDLVRLLLKESMRIYDYGEDKVSIFTAKYGSHYFSTAAAEVEVRAKKAEYEKPGIEPGDLRQKHLDEYQAILGNFIEQHSLKSGIVFTITFEDWQVAWLPGKEA